uniref:Uncharacterized protein n=1 Tax=Anguilla anguilla TaxID=7936 RepID=A0A0E9QB23_ANGAN
MHRLRGPTSFSAKHPQRTDCSGETTTSTSTVIVAR